MKNQVEDDTLPVSLTNKNSLELSLKPLVVLLQIIGLHIPLGNKQQIINPHRYGYGRTRPYWMLGLFGCILLLSHISFWIYKLLTEIIQNDQKPKESNQTAVSDGGRQLAMSALISIIISYLNDIGYSVIIHSSICITVWIVQFNWKLIWINLKEIEINMNLDAQFYRRTAKMCRMFILLLLGHCIFFAVRDTLSKYIIGLNAAYWVLIWINVNHFIIDVILTLFYVMVSCSADLLALLDRRVKALIIGSNCKQINDSLLASELEKWRRHHILVCQYIEHINTCFGLIILTFIAYSFVSFITCCYLLYDSIDSDKNNLIIVSSAELLQRAVHMFTFIGASVKIKSEAIY